METDFVVVLNFVFFTVCMFVVSVKIEGHTQNGRHYILNIFNDLIDVVFSSLISHFESETDCLQTVDKHKEKHCKTQ